jgi:hypothetical protein
MPEVLSRSTLSFESISGAHETYVSLIGHGILLGKVTKYHDLVISSSKFLHKWFENVKVALPDIEEQGENPGAGDYRDARGLCDHKKEDCLLHLKQRDFMYDWMMHSVTKIKRINSVS